MARFSLHRIRDMPGYLLDVQSSHLGVLATRMVVPLIPAAGGPPMIKGLTPIFTVEGEDWIMLTYELAAIERRALGPILGDLSAERDRITAALDLLLTGF